MIESLFEFKGEVRLKREQLYHHLAEFRPDWVLRQPHRLAGLTVARAGGGELGDVPLVIAGESRLALDQATALGKQDGLLQEGPRGIWGLHHDLLRKLRRAKEARA